MCACVCACGCFGWAAQNTGTCHCSCVYRSTSKYVLLLSWCTNILLACCLQEELLFEKAAAMVWTTEQKVEAYTRRLAVNLITVGMLGTASVAIYYASDFSLKAIQEIQNTVSLLETGSLFLSAHNKMWLNYSCCCTPSRLPRHWGYSWRLLWCLWGTANHKWRNFAFYKIWTSCLFCTFIFHNKLNLLNL